MNRKRFFESERAEIARAARAILDREPSPERDELRELVYEQAIDKPWHDPQSRPYEVSAGDLRAVENLIAWRFRVEADAEIHLSGSEHPSTVLSEAERLDRRNRIIAKAGLIANHEQVFRALLNCESKKQIAAERGTHVRAVEKIVKRIREKIAAVLKSK